jgi:heptosyltransferase-2
VKKKILIIRFSSFGDIVQALGAVSLIKDEYEIHWITHNHFADIVRLGRVDRVIPFDRKVGLFGLLQLSLELKREKYDYVYDAHTNVRSAIIKLVLRLDWKVPKIFVRSKDRVKRFLLFKMGINRFSKNYVARESFISPIELIVDRSKKPIYTLKLEENLTKFFNDRTIIIVPSAAWKIKMWPISHWKRLIELLPDYNFLILGGPEDHFLKALEGERVVNLAGKLSLVESCAIINYSSFFVSADTGLLHVADLFDKRGIALIGPTAFGFVASKNIKTMEVSLDCRPCTKDGHEDRCSQIIYQRCMAEIAPELVACEIRSTI